MIQKITKVTGVILLLTGILGFVPGLSTNNAAGHQLLFGIFMTGLFHNVFHLISGAVGLLAAVTEKYSRWYLRIFGAVYAALALLGFSIGIARVNMADHVLHALVGMVLLAIGFGAKSQRGEAMPVKPLQWTN